MSMIGTATNSSPYLAAPAAATIENGKNHFVTLGENGVSLATEGAAAAGILLPDTEDKVAAGERDRADQGPHPGPGWRGRYRWRPAGK